MSKKTHKTQNNKKTPKHNPKRKTQNLPKSHKKLYIILAAFTLLIVLPCTWIMYVTMVGEHSTLIITDRRRAIIILKQDGSKLKDVCDVLKDDGPIVNVAIKQYPRALQYASSRLQNNIKIVRTAVKKDGMALKYASQRLKENKEIVTLAYLQNR